MAMQTWSIYSDHTENYFSCSLYFQAIYRVLVEQTDVGTGILATKMGEEHPLEPWAASRWKQFPR